MPCQYHSPSDGNCPQCAMDDLERKQAMRRSEAAEHALKAIEYERQAVRHCDSLDNPEYVRLIRLSMAEKHSAESFVEQYSAR